MAKYRWILNNGTDSRICYPRWKADTAIAYQFEQQQMFRRATLSNNITFVGSDYDWIMAASFEQKISVTIKVDWNENGTFVDYWSGFFHRTDCTINTDNKTVSVKPTVEDKYNKILAGLDNEYDLIKLTPAIQPVNMTRRPMLQIYSKGEEVVSCFLSSMAWEQDVNEAIDDEGKLIDDYHFGVIGKYVEISFEQNQWIQQPFLGTRQAHAGDGEWNDFGDDGTFKLNYYQFAEAGEEAYFVENGLRIRRVSNDEIVWQFSQSSTKQYPEWDDIPATFIMQARVTGYTNLTGSRVESDIFGRWCVGAGLTGSYEIPTNDIVAYNRNYKYCIPYSGVECVSSTYRSSITPTEWGIKPDGTYYTKPFDDSLAGVFQPVSRTTWSGASLWFYSSLIVQAEEESMRVSTTLRDAFTLEAVLSVLLSQVDNSITFDATSDYSQFLYGNNPLYGDTWGRLVMTPKSNVLTAEYTQPARKAPIKLSEVLKMLRDALGCYWFIDSSNRLRIEHVSWFKNGGSYTSGMTTGINVNQIVNPRNGKPYSFGTNQYSYEKLEMPQRYEYEWMDDTTSAFTGDAIEVVSGYVEQGKIEEINISAFNPDIDYMILNPSMVSEDGFALMCCNVSGGVYSTPIAAVGTRYTKVQNWKLSMLSLRPNFLISDMPAWTIKIDGITTTAKGIQRKKQQQINIPVGNSEPDLQKLVQTGIGAGEIYNMSVNLSSRMAKTTLRYDTTQQ